MSTICLEQPTRESASLALLKSLYATFASSSDENCDPLLRVGVVCGLPGVYARYDGVSSDQLEENDFNICSSIMEADNSVQYKLFQLIKAEQKSSKLDYQSLATEELQKQLFLLYERANKKAINARNKGQFKLCSTWEKVVNILDLACESIEQELQDDSYLIY